MAWPEDLSPPPPPPDRDSEGEWGLMASYVSRAPPDPPPSPTDPPGPQETVDSMLSIPVTALSLRRGGESIGCAMKRDSLLSPSGLAPAP